jgi:uncharacterized small protein (DUF1192 family)
MIAVVTTTPSRAYTIRHPDGRLVAEVLWSPHGRPVLVATKPTEAGDDWRSIVIPSWHKACDGAEQWARDEWRLTVPEPDGDLPVDETPEPPPADPRLLAMANRALGEQLDEARAEVERLRDNEVALVDALNARVAWLTAEVERLRAQLRGVGVEEYLAAKAEVWRLREEVERLRAEHDQLREARRRKLADLEAHARKLETHLQSLADEVLAPVGHDDTVKALARGALRYLDAAPELPEVGDG